jgi:phage FluMu protein Com
MASIYVHLSGRDVDNALLKVHGIKKPEEKEESQLNPKKCPRCQEINQFTNKFCNRCGMILDETLRNRKIQKDLERKQADQILNEMLEDQNIKEMFIRKMNQFFLEGQI